MLKPLQLEQHEGHLITKLNLAHCLREQNKLDEAITLFREIMYVQATTIGTQHENYLDSKFYLACCLREQKKLEEAITLFQEIMDVESDTNGRTSEFYCEIEFQFSQVNHKRRLNRSFKLCIII